MGILSVEQLVAGQSLGSAFRVPTKVPMQRVALTAKEPQ